MAKVKVVNLKNEAVKDLNIEDSIGKYLNLEENKYYPSI